MVKITYRILSLLVFSTLSICAMAQGGTKSPYSQFGFGTLSEQTSGFNRGMNGVGIAFREHNQVNFINPASYSAMDSLMFLFDVGASAQITNFAENGKKLNAGTANFEYAVAGFRIFKNVGFSFGILPFTNVGYNYSVNGYLNDTKTEAYTNTYSGSGGLHQAYIGAGWQFVKGFSIGFNAAYLWGGYDKSISNAYSDIYINNITKIFSADIKSYKLDFGLQYTANVTKKDVLSIGATYSLGHSLNSDASYLILSNKVQAGKTDTIKYSIENAFKLPSTYSVGVMWNHNNKWKVGVDYSLQQWGKVSFPETVNNNGAIGYKLKDNYFKDRHKINIGGEVCPNENSRNFFNRMIYRAGVAYATPYLNINDKEGPKEISVSAGFGIPLKSSYSNRSTLNISGQWVRNSADGLITENSFRINIGITFNERWFQKWKFE